MNNLIENLDSLHMPNDLPGEKYRRFTRSDALHSSGSSRSIRRMQDQENYKKYNQALKQCANLASDKMQ